MPSQVEHGAETNVMSAKQFIDTNVFIYSFDEEQPKKRAKALSLIQGALSKRTGIISTQVVQEFLNVATRKFVKPLRESDARRYLQTVLAPLCEVYPSMQLYEAALGISTETGFSFYDCLIVAAAVSADCDTLLTEDLQHGRNIRGLSIINPFHDA